MLRPQFQLKLRLAFLMLASALIIIAEPAFARKSNENSGRSDRAASSARGSAQQTVSAPAPAARAPAQAPVMRSPAPAPAMRAPAPAPAMRSPAPAPAIRTPEPSRSVQQPSISVQNRTVAPNPPQKVQPQMQSPQSRIITNNPAPPVQNQRVIVNQQPVQPQIRSNNPVSANRNAPSRTNIIQQQENAPSIKNQTVITSDRANLLGSSIGSANRSSSYNSSLNSNSTFNRETSGRNTNQPASRNNSATNRNTESTNSDNRARQPASSPDNRISTGLSSRIGDTIGTQPGSTTTVRQQENKNTRSGVVLPFDRESGSQRTSPQAEVKQPAASSNNRRTIAENPQKSNRVTPPLNSERQPVESSKGTSSLDRANTDIGIMIGPERTPPKTARQPAAIPNNRENRESTSRNGRIGDQEKSETRMQRPNSIGEAGRADSSIANRIGERDAVSPPDEKTGRTPESGRATVGDTSGRADRRNDRSQIGQDNNREFRPSGETTTRTEITRINPDRQPAIVTDARVNQPDGRRDLRVHRYEPARPQQIVIRDRPYTRDRYHDDYIFIDHYNHLYRRTITPGFRVSICYDYGPRFTYRHIYPYYHRKYVFVSLGGYWPLGYNYIRYYWYGYHPYYWYGYYPIARQVSTDVQNYYTYNYYYTNDSSVYDTTRMTNPEYYDSIASQPAPQPKEPTLADTYFEEAVDSFEAGKYDLANEKFSRAMELAPDDSILPFAYSQSLFASGKYTEAAEVLRTALAKVKPDQEGVFYPRGLYPDEDVLLAQLDKLADTADHYSFDPDLQLLLGYQLLGINEHDKAVTPLKNASLDMKNKDAATVLLNLLTKIKLDDLESKTIEEPKKTEPEKVIPLIPENTAPEKIEPNKNELNENNSMKLDLQKIMFIDSGDSTTEDAEIESIEETQIPFEKASAANDPTHSRAKEGILFAALFVLAGSTGLGHLLHH